MKVFLSWSGDRSRRTATAFKEWLPLVVHEVELFMSSEIEAGARWQSEVLNELASTDFGIVFVTAQNQGKPWLNFEAGALSKTMAISRVVPLAIDLRPAEVALPLGQFQAQALDAQGIRRIVSAINNVRPRPLSADHLERVFSRFWPDFDNQVSKILNDAEERPSVPETGRTDRELLEEVVESVRSLNRAARSPAGVFDPVIGTGLTEADNLFRKILSKEKRITRWTTVRSDKNRVELYVDIPPDSNTNELLEAAAVLNGITLEILPRSFYRPPPLPPPDEEVDDLDAPEPDMTP